MLMDHAKIVLQDRHHYQMVKAVAFPVATMKSLKMANAKNAHQDIDLQIV